MKCPYCRSKNEAFLQVSQRSYRRCPACGIISKEKRKIYEKLVEQYETDYFGSHAFTQFEQGREILSRHILAKISPRKSANESRLLDVGAGCGQFLHMAREHGWQVQGVDPSLQSIQAAHQQFNLEITPGTIQSLPDGEKFEVITFINVLDHSAAPWLELSKAFSLLKPGGMIYIRCPNGIFHTTLQRIASAAGITKYINKYLVFHEYSLTPHVLRMLLRDFGFVRCVLKNSPMSEGDPYNLLKSRTMGTYLKKLIQLTARTVAALSFDRIVCGSSMEAVAYKKE